MILTSLIDGNRETRELADGTYIIGRGDSCRIRFPLPDVSERHAVLTVRGGAAVLEDLHSANGTIVNGERIDTACRLDGSMVVQIGSGMFRVSEAAEPPPAVLLEEESRDPGPEVEEGSAPRTEADPLRELRRNVQTQIQMELLKRMDMKKLTVQGEDREGLEDSAREKIRQIIDEVVANGRFPRGIDPVRMEEDVFNESMRLGPLEALLEDDSVSEIMVNGPEKVYVERNGKLQLSDCQFADDASVMAVIERIVSPLGRRIDESQPYVDARLADGSRVNAIIAPLALSGPTITIRKFAKKALTPGDFIRFGTWTKNAAEFMRLCVILRKNIIVAGGTGSGKTSLINLIPRFYDATEGMVLIDGADVRSYTAESLAKRIAVVPQKAVLFEGTIRENMRLGNETATDEEINRALEIAQASTVAEQKGGLDGRIEQGGKNLSGGQRQRLTIARALVKDADILILDDSASALDYATDASLRKAIRSMEGEKTVFIVSQRASSIMHADKIIVLEDGEAVGIGTHDELLSSSPVYREIYDSQFGEAV